MELSMNKLLENAIVSIKIGVDDFFSTDKDRIFSCVRNLFSGIILLFKSKLLDLCPLDSNEVLIKKNIVPMMIGGEIVFKGEGKNTVDINEIRQRFAALNIKTNWSIIDKIQRERNNIEHYYADTDSDALRSIIVNTFNITSDFIKLELKQNPRILLKDSWDKLLEIREIFLKEKDDCNKKTEELFNLEERQLIVIKNMYCNKCGSELLVPKDGANEISNAIIKCTKCSNEIKVIDNFEKIVDEVYNYDGYERARNGYDSRIKECPECGKKTFNEDDDICYYCSYEKDYTECVRCGAELSIEEQDCDGLCFYCFDQFQKLNKDD
jgi:hypothetical protein